MTLLILSKILQIVGAGMLVVFILIQSKGKGLSSAVGSSIGFYRSRRGVEKLVFTSTVVLGVFLVLNSLLIIYLS